MFKNFNQKGFTLIELIIVITILAILSAVAVQSFSGQGKAAKTSAHAANLTQIENAADRFAVDFEWEAADLQVLIDNSHKLVTYGYLRKAPVNPWVNDSAMNAKDFGYVLDFKIIDINGKLKLQAIPRLVKLSGTAIHGDNDEITNNTSETAIADFTPALTTDANYTTYFN